MVRTTENGSVIHAITWRNILSYMIYFHIVSGRRHEILILGMCLCTMHVCVRVCLYVRVRISMYVCVHVRMVCGKKSWK